MSGCRFHPPTEGAEKNIRLHSFGSPHWHSLSNAPKTVVRAQERIHTCHIQFQIFAEISLHIDTSTETFQIVRFHNRLMIVVIEGGVDLKPLATSIERNVVIMDQAGTAYFVKMIIRLGLLQLILIIQHSQPEAGAGVGPYG